MMQETQEANDEGINGRSMNRRQAFVMGATSVVLNSLSYIVPKVSGRIAEYLWFTPFPFARSRTPEIPSGARRVTFGSGNSKVHGYEIGDGPKTALLVHGWAGSSRQYRRMALRLADVGIRSVVIDLPGHGIEAGRSTDVIEFAQAIEITAQNLGKIDLIVAHSFGAIATSMAMQNSLRAERLVLLAPGLWPHKILEAFASNLQLRPVVTKLVERTMEERFGEDIWERVPTATLAMKVPDRTLIIHDIDDDIMPREEAQLLAESWGIKLTTTRGYGHNGVLRASEVIDQVTSLATAEQMSG